MISHSLLLILQKHLAQQTFAPRAYRLSGPFRTERITLRSVRLSAFCAFLTFCFLNATNVLAAPVDEIRNAVIAGGAGNVEAATPAQFVRAFSAVLTRVPERKYPDYVSGAIKLRSDLAPQITVAALRAHENDPKDSCHWVDPILRAAIAAAPTAKDAIVRAALQAEPFSKECIFAAAGIKDGDGIGTAFFRPSGVDAGSINSSAIGTINPANLSAQGNEVSRSRP